MGWASVFPGLAVAAVSSVWVGLLLRLWCLRRKFEIAARSPSLVFLSNGVSYLLSISVLVQWFMLSMDEALPCLVVFCVSYMVYCAVVAYFIRVVRLAIAYNKSYRIKYARYVKWTPMMWFLAGASVALATRASFFWGELPEHSSRGAGHCFYFDYVVLLSILVVAGGPFLIITNTLLHVHDVFNIRGEILRSIGGSMILSTITVSIELLVRWGALEDTKSARVVVEVLTLCWGINVGIWGLVVPMVAYHKKHGWIIRGVVPSEEDGEIGGKWNYDVKGVLEIANSPGEMRKRFESFVMKNLCMESWDFIMESVSYGNIPSDDRGKQFETFLHILDQYLLPTSPDEVNISSSMSKRIAAFKGREAFDELDDEARRVILKEPLNEIVHMLEMNLLNKFRSVVQQQTEIQISQAAGGDTELMAIMKSTAHSDISR